MCGFTSIFVFDMLRIISLEFTLYTSSCMSAKIISAKWRSYVLEHEISPRFLFSFLYEGDANKLALTNEKIEF